MYRTFALAASIAALSIPAFAGDVTISLEGKSKAQIESEIHKAAEAVCLENGYTGFGDRVACIRDVEDAALASAARKTAKNG